MPWIRFWSRANCSCSSSNSDNSVYRWYDKVPNEEELKDQAEELVPNWMRTAERGYKYGSESAAKLPDDVRTGLLQGYKCQKKHAEKMIELLEMTEVMEG